ncbi:hypothetical protein MC885_002709 [Smutsia gigantea]|nr:hypothetical protein MC885_002709 [Smutsia gigantea]
MGDWQQPSEDGVSVPNSYTCLFLHPLGVRCWAGLGACLDYGGACGCAVTGDRQRAVSADGTWFLGRMEKEIVLKAVDAHCHQLQPPHGTGCWGVQVVVSYLLDREEIAPCRTTITVASGYSPAMLFLLPGPWDLTSLSLSPGTHYWATMVEKFQSENPQIKDMMLFSYEHAYLGCRTGGAHGPAFAVPWDRSDLSSGVGVQFLPVDQVLTPSQVCGSPFEHSAQEQNAMVSHSVAKLVLVNFHWQVAEILDRHFRRLRCSYGSGVSVHPSLMWVGGLDGYTDVIPSVRNTNLILLSCSLRLEFSPVLQNM